MGLALSGKIQLSNVNKNTVLCEPTGDTIVCQSRNDTAAGLLTVFFAYELNGS